MFFCSFLFYNSYPAINLALSFADILLYASRLSMVLLGLFSLSEPVIPPSFLVCLLFEFSSCISFLPCSMPSLIGFLCHTRNIFNIVLEHIYIKLNTFFLILCYCTFKETFYIFFKLLWLVFVLFTNKGR